MAGLIALLLALCLPSVAQGTVNDGGRSAGAQAVPPTAPTGLRATVAGRTVTLTWNANPEADLSHYSAWRNRNPDPNRSDWRRLPGTSSNPTSSETVPEPGTYFFYVVAVNTLGQASAKSSVIRVDVLAPPTPTNLRATVTGQTVSLTWDASLDPAFSHFSVRRDTQPVVTTSTWTRVGGNFTGFSATDTPGVGRYWYYVSQVSRDGNFSAKSSTVEVQVVPPPVDVDKDGYPRGDDCDDANAAVNPGAKEVPNRTDDNCNGFVDEIEDKDGDGVKAAEFRGNDCNDSNPAIRPGAPDVTNGIDDDCDGIIDPDVDGDGYPSDQDCNNADPAIRPGTVELRGNRVDENCDGIVEPRPRITTRLQVVMSAGRTTRVTRLRALNLPANTTISVSCRGRGCPRGFTQRLTKARGSHSLTRRFRRARLRPGAVLQVKISAAGFQGRRFRYEIRRNRSPRTSSVFFGDPYA